MRLRLVAPRQGLVWIQQGFRVFFRQPLVFTALFFAFLFGAFMLLVVPTVGPLLVLMLLPAVTQGFMIATRQALSGRPPMPTVFAAPFRNGRPRAVAMLQLGAGYTVASLLVMFLANWADGGTVEALQAAMARGDATREMMDDPRVQTGLMLRMGLTVPLALLFWHAPALVHWHGVSAPKAVFFSIVACWRNKLAFIIYFLGWTALVMVFGVVATVMLSLLGAPQLVSLAAFPAAMMYAAVFYVSLYFTFIDCFGSEEDAPHDDAPA